MTIGKNPLLMEKPARPARAGQEKGGTAMRTEDLTASLARMDRTALVAALMDGSGLSPAQRRLIPGLPPEDVQIATTGKAGERNILEAVDFCRAVMERYRRHCGAGAPAVLDFGCGWGRITRTFLSATPAGRITGVDVRPDAVEMARALAPAITFHQIDPRAPAPMLADAAFDMVVAYSVFSHLSEDVAQSWIDEFARIVIPGGLVCITTRPRAHLVYAKAQAADVSGLTGHQKLYSTMLSDFDAAIARYDAGGFVYVPTGGGGVLSPDYYGEAIVPRAYAERQWQNRFDLVDWVEKFSDIGSQPIIILKRRSG